MRISVSSKPFYLLLAGLFIAGSFLQGHRVQAQDIDNSLLWTIDGNGTERSYLFGTIHVLPQSDFELKPKVVSAFEECKKLVMELDMSNPNMQTEMMKYAMMTDGTTLDQLLEQEDYQRLDTMLNETMGLRADMVKTFKPFIVSTFLLGRYIGEQPASFELTLTRMATEGEKEIVGLETVEDQMRVFDKISYKSQADDLEEMINDESEMRKMYADMIELYRKEYTSELFDTTTEYLDDSNETAIMLFDRNVSWIPLFKEIAAEAPCFFAVGAAHLGGEKGLINLLRREGYTVEPVLD